MQIRAQRNLLDSFTADSTKKGMRFISDRISALKERNELTYNDLAYASGLSKATLWRLMANRTRFPRYQTIIKVFSAFDYAITIQEEK